MRKLDNEKFKVDESRSNPMVVALTYPDCPISEVCSYMAVGFGSIVKQCSHFRTKGDEAICKNLT